MQRAPRTDAGEGKEAGMESESLFAVLDAVEELRQAVSELTEAFASFIAAYGTPEERSPSLLPPDR